MRTTQDPVPTLPVNGSYVIGVDTGQNSVGLAAIALDEHDMPVEILAAQSIIHDSGVDPDSNKSGDTRLAVSGVARRNRRRLRVTRKRLRKLSTLLEEQGWIPSEKEASPGQVWEDRARAASEYIEDDAERGRILADSFNHIARHRGWRNPYTRVENLLSADNYTPSPGYRSLEENVLAQGAVTPVDATVAELVMAAVEIPEPAPHLEGEDAARWDKSGHLRIRSRAGGEDPGPGLLAGRQFQEDYGDEVRQICAMQKVPEEVCRKLILTIFTQNEPGKAAIKRVGKDELQPHLKRAPLAHPQFQRYRIAATLAILKIRKDNEVRPLTVEERQKVYDLLTTSRPKDDPVEWADVADLLDVEVRAIRGIATPTGDPTMLVGHRPPVDATTNAILNSTFTTLKKWWKAADEDQREEFIENQVNYADVDGEVAEFLLSLSEDELTKLDGISFPAGRAAYSIETCRMLADEMLSTEKDLHTARKDVFNLPDDWRPTPDPVGAPTGNPAVDRTLKVTARFLAACEKYWGEPARITVEVARDGLISEKTARKQQNLRSANSLYLQRRKLIEDGALPEGSRRSTFYRWEAIQRQAGKCLYCGAPITLQDCEMDHIVPRSGPGATNQKSNLAATCHRCNMQKGGRTYAMWVKQENPSFTSYSQVCDFVKSEMDLPGTARQQARLRREFLRNLSTLSEEEPLDSRSIASTATMATLLHTRLRGHYPNTRVNVVSGFVTSEARRASAISDLPLAKLKGDDRRGKTRLDRRHHAIDAVTVSLIRQRTAQVLAERGALRSEQAFLGESYRPDPDTPQFFYGKWQDYTGSTVENKAAYGKWQRQVEDLRQLLLDALENDEIPVVQALRLSRTDGAAHNDTVYPLAKRKVSDAFTASEIDASAIPGQWCALTRLPDYDPKKGLPADPERRIRVNGTHLGPDDMLEFFTGTSAKALTKIKPQAALKVRKGWVSCGNFHHLRLYAVKEKTGYKYHFMRIFPGDLPSSGDLFSFNPPPQSLSIRLAHPKLREALLKGEAKYLTWATKKDELILDPTYSTGAMKTLSDAVEGGIKHWMVVGFKMPNMAKIRPRYLSSEGVLDSRVGGKILNCYSDDLQKAIASVLLHHSAPSTNSLVKMKTTVVRRDALGRIRINSKSNLPQTYTFREE